VKVTRRLLSTREGTLAVAALAGIVALGILLTFISGYKRQLSADAQPITVLVARQPLAKGTSGDLMAAKGLFQATGLQRDQVKQEAITDPGSLRGMVAAHDLVRGQQLTLADFTHPNNQVLSRLGPDERAVAVPLDSAHGMLADVQAGDHVDIFAGFDVQPNGTGQSHPVLRVLLQNVQVLEAPGGDKQGGIGSGASTTRNLVLKVPEEDAPELAFASDNGTLWITMRPPAGAKQHMPSLVTLERLLLGMRPIPVNRFLAKKRGLINRIYQGDIG
jgi:Flp pilus assembly protein CpaB